MITATPSDVVLALGDAALKGALLLTAAAGLTSLMRRASAAARHLVWSVAVAGVLAIPVLSIVAPRWSVPVLPAALADSRLDVVIPSADDRTVETSTMSVASRAPVAPAAFAPTPEMRAPNAASVDAPAPVTRGSISIVAWIALVWALGALVVLARLVFGTAGVTRLVRRAESADDPTWIALLQRLSRELGIRRPVMLLIGRTGTMPVTWGVVYPVVLLPADATSWNEARRRAVLLHELAHVERFDALTHVMSQLALAIFWFNPLVSLAARRLRSERERACDDLVLAVGMPASSYAGDLLELVQSLGTTRTAGAALAMARRSEFEGRLLAILDPAVPRARTSRRATALAGALVAIAVVPLAAARPIARLPRAPRPPAVSDLPAAPTPVASGPGVLPPTPLTPAAPTSPSVASLGTPPTPPVPPQPPVAFASMRRTMSECAPRSGRHVSIDAGAVRSRTIISDAAHCVQIDVDGRIEFTEDETDVASLSPGGALDMAETRGGVTRQLSVRERDGRLVRTYFVDGTQRALDEGAAWIRTIIPVLTRETTVGVAARVARVRRQRGVAGVLGEIESIASDGVKRAWFEALLAGAPLGEDDLVRSAVAARSITSDGDKASVLRAIADRAGSRAAVASAVVATARTLTSDGDRRSVLEKVTDARPSQSLDVLTHAALAAREMTSDGDKAAILTVIAPRAGESPALRNALLEGATTISSDGDRARVLLALLATNVDEAMRIGALRAARGISSDGDRARVLTAALAPGLLRGETVRTTFFATVDGIASDGDRSQVLLAVLRRGSDSSAATMTALVRSAGRMSSDDEKARVLLAVAQFPRALQEPSVRDAFFAALRTVSSGTDYRRVMEAVVR